jgi:predicted Zn-dependent peptidase
VAASAVATVAVAAAAAAAVGVAAVAADPLLPGWATADPQIERTDLPSGVRVVTERMPEARSASVGLWFGVGSRDEPEPVAGVSHFLEHLLFKGTPERSARSIAMAVDAVGGEMNAYTSREHTAYYTRLPASQLRFGLDLLVDVVSEPAFRPAEIDAERDVIVEELLMSEDTPDDLVFTALYEGLFPEHPLGRETLGTRDTVEEMTRDEIAGFHQRWYRPANLVVAAAGDVHHAEVLDAVVALLADGPVGEPPQRSAPPAELVPLQVVHRPTEQAHVALGWRGLPVGDDDRYALTLANHVLGGGLSSRLFQEVREERGLAYTVFSAPSSYADAGSLSVYAGTAPERLDELLAVVQGVLDDLLANGITDEEHAVAQGYVEGSMLLGLEDSGSRMSRLANGVVSRNEVIAVEEHLRRYREVTTDDVHRVLRRVLAGPRSVSVVGPLSADDRSLARLTA